MTEPIKFTTFTKYCSCGFSNMYMSHPYFLNWVKKPCEECGDTYGITNQKTWLDEDKRGDGGHV